MKGNYYITYADRQKISALYQSNVRPADIAVIMEINLATIYRELARGYTGALDRNGNREYSAERGQRMVQESMSHRGKRRSAIHITEEGS